MKWPKITFARVAGATAVSVVLASASLMQGAANQQKLDNCGQYLRVKFDTVAADLNSGSPHVSAAQKFQTFFGENNPYACKFTGQSDNPEIEVISPLA